MDIRCPSFQNLASIAAQSTKAQTKKLQPAKQRGKNCPLSKLVK